MEAGQKVFVASAGFYGTEAYGSIIEGECAAVVAGTVVLTWPSGGTDVFPEADVFQTRRAAVDACIRKLRDRQKKIDTAIAAKITTLEGQS